MNNKVIAAVDSRGGKVVIHGWKTTLPITAVDAIQALDPYVGEFLYTHVDKEGLMQGTDMDAIKAVRDATGGNDPAALRDAAVSGVRAVVTGNPGQAQQARERAAQAISKAQNISIEDARKQVQQYEEQYRQSVEQAKQQAAKAADATAGAVSKGSLFGAIALVLGAIAGWFGGRAGKIDPTLTSGELRAGV